MFAELTREELAAGLDAVAGELLAGAEVDSPPVDAFLLARRLGITVALDDGQQNRARYVRLDSRRPARSRPTILLRSDPRRERRHWAVAHEIGEYAAHRVFAHWGVDVREVVPRAREEVANCLAGRLLLPTEWFLADARAGGWDLAALKARYATASHELIARRMLECPPPVIVTIFDHRVVSFRRSNLPGRVPPPSAAEMACWRVVHDAARSQRVDDGPRAVQGWPVHEPQWKREILRAEVEEE
ncbi:MAG: ImmA/IrrE family metallo-endopeptidase [Thermoguttaceae bacterium]